MKQLSPTDAMFYNMDSTHNPATIAVMWICDQSQAPNGVVRHKEILDYLNDRISCNSMFRRRLQKAPLSLDFPYWLEDDNFDLEYHVKHVGLPQPGDWRQLCIFTSRIMSRAMDNDRAPWEIYIIEGLNNVENVPEGSFAVLIRLHHAYVDGQSGIELLTGLMTDTQTPTPNPHHVEYVERTPTATEMWARTAPRLLGQTFKSAKAGYKGIRKGFELYSRLRGESRPDQSRSPDTMFTAKVSPHRVYSSISWEIAELQKVRKLHEGSSLNDVIVAIVGGGMRRYLTKHDNLPADESLTAICPVSVRPKTASKEGGNMVSGMVIGIGTNIEDAVTRLELVRQRTARGIPLAREVVHELGDAMNDLMPAYMHNMQAWAMGKLDLASKFTAVNTIITNVPGPVGDQKFFAGAPILNVHPVVPIADGIAITHGITGVGSKLTMGILSDRAIIGDIDFYIECMQASTDEYTAKAKEFSIASKAAADATAKAVAESRADVVKAKTSTPEEQSNAKPTRKKVANSAK